MVPLVAAALMEEKIPPTKEGFSAVQGCLIAAVVLFIVLLGVSVVLGYRQFRKHTADPAAATALHGAQTATPSIWGGFTLNSPTFSIRHDG